ncbi:uncharacterized protein LOC125551684 isoform X3 [Triticum urartu]|uniref:uncharacterized protein LOC125551684 isoform X3 n=1 Tax=Triticum urartu TaxID=4572 RepID=UPI0020439C5B|nr:uncharacterized protein LOC125551684 isoform X3 [Triticum urartu]
MVGSSARVGWSSGGKGVAKQYYLQGRSPEAVPPDDGRLTRGSYWRRPTRAPWPHLCSSGPARQLPLQIVGPAWRLPLQLGRPAGPVASAATRSCRWCARCCHGWGTVLIVLITIAARTASIMELMARWPAVDLPQATESIYDL